MSNTDPYAAASKPKKIGTAPVDVVKTEPVTEPVKSTEQVPDDSNIEEVMDWVGEDKDRAQIALDTEQNASKPRKTLVEKLKDIV